MLHAHSIAVCLQLQSPEFTEFSRLVLAKGAFAQDYGRLVRSFSVGLVLASLFILLLKTKGHFTKMKLKSQTSTKKI